MLKISYIHRLSLAARWLLPHAEAVEVIEDYREMLAGREEKTLKERFGPPLKAVLSVAERGKMLAWVLFFAVALIFHFFFLYSVKYTSYYTLVVLVMSAVTSGLLLRLLGLEKLRNPLRGVPKHILGLCILLVIFIILLFTPAYYLLRFYNNPYPWYYNTRFYSVLYGSVIFFTLLSLMGIILARMLDRRWRAVSILSLTVVCVAFYFLSIFGNMDPSCDPVIDVVLLNHEGIVVAIAGVLTAGVGLC